MRFGFIVFVFFKKGTMVYTHHVVLTEELGRFDAEEMISSGYDLSLFTCTVGGKVCVTVRCTRDS